MRIFRRGLIWLNLICLKWLVKHYTKHVGDHHFHTLELDSNVYNRIDYLLKVCSGKKILHFGFADAPLTEQRLSQGRLLHSKIQSVSKYVFGLDYDSDAIEMYKAMTSDTNVASVDIHSLKNLELDFKKFDIFLLGEILEHLGNPLLALESIKDVISDDAQLVVTVPNAFSLSGFYKALYNLENTHPEHVAFYSPVTLRKLLDMAGFECLKIDFWGEGAIVSF